MGAKEQIARAWSFATQRPRKARAYRIGAFHHAESGPRVAVALSKEEVYTAIFLPPEGTRQVASHIAALNARETRHSKQVIIGAERPGRARFERARDVWRLLRGAAPLSDAFAVAVEDVAGREVIVLALRDQRERASAAYYLLTPGMAASEFAARLERAASVADGLSVGSPVQNVA